MKAIIVAAGRGRRLGPRPTRSPSAWCAVGGRADPAPPARRAGRGRRRRRRHRARLPGRSDRARGRRRRQRPALHREPGLGRATTSWRRCSTPSASCRTGFLFSYSDIVFAHRARAARGRSRSAAVALVIDRRWRDAYVGRVQHPVSEAELARSRSRATARASRASASAWCPPSRRPASSSASRSSRPRAPRRWRACGRGRARAA